MSDRQCKHCSEPAPSDRWECGGCKSRLYRERKLLCTQSEREKKLEDELKEMTLSRDETRTMLQKSATRIQELEDKLKEMTLSRDKVQAILQTEQNANMSNQNMQEDVKQQLKEERKQSQVLEKRFLETTREKEDLQNKYNDLMSELTALTLSYKTLTESLLQRSEVSSHDPHPVDALESTTKTQPPGAKNRLCLNCGKRVYKGAFYCTDCKKRMK